MFCNKGYKSVICKGQYLNCVYLIGRCKSSCMYKNNDMTIRETADPTLKPIKYSPVTALPGTDCAVYLGLITHDNCNRKHHSYLRYDTIHCIY